MAICTRARLWTSSCRAAIASARRAGRDSIGLMYYRSFSCSVIPVYTYLRFPRAPMCLTSKIVVVICPTRVTRVVIGEVFSVGNLRPIELARDFCPPALLAIGLWTCHGVGSAVMRGEGPAVRAKWAMRAKWASLAGRGRHERLMTSCRHGLNDGARGGPAERAPRLGDKTRDRQIRSVVIRSPGLILRTGTPRGPL